MPDETSPSPKPAPALSEPPLPSGASLEARALSELRKEVVEARNLVIKTDNLLKNMHAELKKFGERQEEFSRRRFWSSATAFVIFAALCAALAITIARTEGSREREAAQAAEQKAKSAQAQADAAVQKAQVRKEATEKAARIYEQLSSEKEGPGMNAAITNAARLDRAQLSPLEARALDDRLAALRDRLAQRALEQGQAAFRRGDHKTTSEELGRYLELVPHASDPQLWFHLGYARALLKEHAGVVEPMEKFLKASPGGRTGQTAGYYLGVAYEETGAPQKALEAYQKAHALFPGSELASLIRQRLRKLPGAQGQAPAAPAAKPAAALVPPAAPASPAPAAPPAAPAPR